MSEKQKKILTRISEILDILPGKITRQYNVCGTPNCKCKRKENPEKHGPYHYLSFTFKGKGRTMGIPVEMVKEVEKRNENFKEMKSLIEQLAEISIENLKGEVSDVRKNKKFHKC